MKRLLFAGLTIALLVPACALAQSMFNGTWKLDPSTVHAFGGKAMVVTLDHGMFSRSNADPAFKVKADGKDHAVSGHKGYDTVAVEVINDHAIRETDKKDGKVVSVVTATAAANGQTATVKMNNPGRFAATELVDRVGMREPGSNAVAGSWRFARVIDASGKAFAPTYKIDGGTVTESGMDGSGYTAKLGGKPVPHMVNGKPEGMVAVAMLGKNTLRETYTKDGKVTDTDTLTISADGKTMMMVGHDMQDGGTTAMLHYKQ